jgi:hypothetical protein
MMTRAAQPHQVGRVFETPVVTCHLRPKIQQYFVRYKLEFIIKVNVETPFDVISFF